MNRFNFCCDISSKARQKVRIFHIEKQEFYFESDPTIIYLSRKVRRIALLCECPFFIDGPSTRSTLRVVLEMHT